MASLQTLRNKGGVIVAVVIGIALLAFVMGDMFSSGSTLLGSDNNVGEINGTSITNEQYFHQRAMLTEVAKVAAGTETITEEQLQSVEQQAWSQLVARYATTPELNDIGVSVGVAEMAELITGRYVSPMVQQLFSNPETGQFDANYVRQFVANVSQDPTGRLQAFWSNLQTDVHNQAQLMKYKVLVDKGSYITSQQADFMAELEGANYSVRFVASKISDVADSTVSVSHSEIEKFYNENKASFKRGTSRSIEYVVFEALPSTIDYTAAAKYMSELKSDFETTDDIKQFASLNSQSPFDSRYYKEGELGGELGEFAFTATAEQIYAPEIAGDQYILARVADAKVMPDSVNFSHIMLDPTNKAMADSLIGVIRSGNATFAELAALYSNDPQTSINGGVIGTVDPQTLFADFAAPILTMKSGEVKIVALPQSLHIIKVNSVIGMGRKVQLGKIDYTVEASEGTRALAFNRASNFANNAKKIDFSKLVADSMLSKRTARIAPEQRELQGYEDSREVIRWVYNAKEGASSDVMEFGNSFMVVSFTDLAEEGTAPLKDVESDIKSHVAKLKIAQLLADKMRGGTVASLATTLGVEVIDGTDINFATYIAPEVGLDPAFAGGICGTSMGATSKPIVGMAAVYVAELTDVVSNPISSLMVRERLKAEQQQSAFAGAYQTLLENSGVTDERYKAL